MPFIISRVSTEITAQQETELKTRLGKAIELIPGKSEEYLLLGFEDNYHLYLRGDNSEPTAYIEASVFGNENHFGYKAFTAAVTKIFNDILGIAPDRIYIRYSDITAWGVQGLYIDREMIR